MPEFSMAAKRDRRDEERAELVAVLSAAKKAVARGDGWAIEPAHYNRLRADCEPLGLKSEFAITIGLRRAFEEITADDLRRRRDKSYAGLQPDQTLYQARWESSHFSRMMYVKFALTEDGIELFTFHENSEQDE